MKKILIALLVLISFYLNAQVPQAFSYQGVAFDAEGAALSEISISIEIKILRESAQGTTVYSEQHTSTTNAAGLYNLNIGQGTSQQGEFENIDWSSLPMFISVGLDADGSGTFRSVGTSQLLSVPYALRAGAAEVEPIIFVEAFPSFSEPGEPTVTVSNRGTSQITNPGDMKIYYEWIQGRPEDVFVEYVGLPDNISIFTRTIAGFMHPSYQGAETTTGIDTIFGGQLQKSSVLGRHDLNVAVPNGLYPLTLIYRTKDKVLDSIKYNLRVITNFYDDCLPAFPFVKPLISNDCTEIESNIESSISFTEISDQIVNFSLPFGNNLGDATYFLPDDCSRTSIFASAYETFGDFDAEIRNVFIDGDQYVFDIEVTNRATSERRTCRVSYQ